MSEHSDDELMKRIARGEEKAFSQLFLRHSSRVLGYSRRLLSDAGSSEDVSQDVWLKVVKMAPSYQSQNQFPAWVMTLTRNSALDVLRTRARFTELKNDEAELIPDVSRESIESELSNSSDVTMIRQAIDELPESQRTVLVLWMSEDVSYEQISRDLGISLSSVKSLLFRARENLKAKLGGTP